MLRDGAMNERAEHLIEGHLFGFALHNAAASFQDGGKHQRKGAALFNRSDAHHAIPTFARFLVQFQDPAPRESRHPTVQGTPAVFDSMDSIFHLTPSVL